ncbi:MAG: hypothetical protein KKD97_01705 [Gammaproteobacteria bacterium]|nr:hypothetical protein [Gammaproteobacteria bacterium]
MLKPPLPANARTNLAQVTLCCIDTRSPELALYAMRRCMQHLAFARCVLISSAQARHLDLGGIDLVEIEPLKAIDDYSKFVIKRLADHVQTSHVLLIQWDGFVRDAQMWSDDFLDFDYIGAPWTSGALADQVGNGGFTLRSRQLLQALQSDEYAAHNPEDVCIAVTHRAGLEREHHIRFADTQTARRFACERGPWRPAFGFHAVFNLPHVLSSDELVQFSAALPAHLAASSDARHLIRDLIRQGEFAAAQTLLKKRTQHLGWHADAWRQRLQLAWARLRRMR